MENRRQHYRHVFSLGRRLRVRLTLAEREAAYDGEVLDLSVGGMRLRFKHDLSLEAKQHVLARISRSSAAGVEFRFGLPSEVVHAKPNRGGCDYGVCFLPSEDPTTTDTYRRAIWRILSNEQRRGPLRVRG
jgi:hypothetical protein